ncbi:SusC/RagA family TonB-linked outer membrane protein [Daejeonella sp.]|uniref:SusC/RagA family TonB-linked outer membrane protein n=1 Tax=Daejeonella sp. TaxID=2805397 RepID=UPI002734D79C|nr:SusC/RagA family TonB-linked outer membrane protein [Daejeonella sp.]
MKLTFILLLALILNVRAEGYSQKVTYSGKNVPIEKVFSTIKKQTGYGFFFQKELISLAKPVTINAVDEDLSDVLATLFKDQPLEFSIKNKTILVLKRTASVMIPESNLINISDLLEVKDIVVKGQITDAQGVTLPGVSIKLKGTTVGATTDIDGRFTINVPDNNSVLVFTYIGYQTQEVTVGSRTTLNIKLEAANTALTEVVVTALGISREKKALAYSVTEVKGEEFTQARENNIANAFTGKIAGVNVTGMSSGPGGSSRVIIRGNGSLSGNNQPLYVINGLPMNNTARSQAQGEGSTILDRGDGIAAINPDDIETINVLKGGPAAALYGSQASNGVILITTKSGKAQKGIGVEFNSNFTVGSPSMYPDFQYEYGQGLDGVKPTTRAQAISSGRLSFGAKMDGQPSIQFDGVMRPYSPVNVKDNWKNFYRPSTNLTNTLAFSGGSSPSLTYRLSISDLEAQAMEPKSSYNRQTGNLSLRSVLGKRIIVESTLQYNVENGKNRPGNGYADNTTSWATNLLANTVDIRNLAPGYDANFNEVQWQQVPEAQNPYFVINRMGNTDTKNRFMGQSSIQYNILDELSLKLSGMRDIDRFESMDYMPIGTAKRPRGLFNSGTSFVTKTTAQALLNYNKTFFEDFQISAMVGGNIERNKSESTSNTGAEFIVPDFISFSNLALQSASVGLSRFGQNSVFGSADIGYKSLLYFTFTGRQDWFSTLNPGNNSIFYPSFGTSFILSDAIKLPSLISFAKIRASWAQVGGATVNPYQINQLYYFAQGGHLGRPVQMTNPNPASSAFALSNPDLRPLTSTTYEGGIDMQFLNNRLGIDFTYYNRKTTDDILSTSIAASSGYTSALLNVGELSNKGVELLLTGTPIKSNNFTWDVSYNAAYNKSEIEKLAPGLSTVGGAGVGRPYNTIRGRTYLTNASGVRVYNRISGYEVQGPEIEYGQGVPPYTMGLTNNFRYKNFSLNVLLDAKFGNIVQSGLSRYMYRFGLLKNTLPGRENGLTVTGVDQAGLPFTKTWPVDQLDTYYNNQASLSPLETSVFDGDFIKLRSAVLSYRLPVNKLQSLKIQSADISLVARNPFILFSHITDFDPESAYTIGNNQGQSSNTIPRTREFGLNLIVRF